MGKTEKASFRKEWIGAALLFILVLWLFVTGWRIHLYGSKIQGLEAELGKAIAQENQATQTRAKAFLCASAASELEGWKKAAPFASDFTRKLANLPAGLLVHEFSVERQFTLKSLSSELAGEGVPLPVRALRLSDHVLLEICETEPGSGVRSFPRFLSRMSQQFGQSLQYERGALDTRWSEPGAKVEGESNWSLSAERISSALWNNVLEQP